MSCNKCESGFIHAMLKENPNGYYIFKCDCPLGRARTEAYPTWDNRDVHKWISHKKYLSDHLKSNVNDAKPVVDMLLKDLVKNEEL